MKTSFLVSAVLTAAAHLQFVNAAASSGCGIALSPRLTRGGADKTNSMTFTTSGGVQRSYLLHIPSSYDTNTPAPIAFSYHGRTETPQDQESISGMSNEIFNPNYLVVYPAGLSLQWQGDPEATGYDDVGFTLELLTNLSSTYCIDSSRVYAAGKSNGGGFAANILACDAKASRIFAAFGGMSGAYYQGTTDVNCNALSVPITCTPGRVPIPIFTTHGDADATISYNGGARRGGCLPTLPHFMTEWGKRDGFGTSNTSVSLYSGNVIRYDYGNVSFPGLSSHYWVHNLGHTWPSIAAGTWFEATPLLLAFWNKWTLDTTPHNYMNVVTSSTSSSSIGVSTSTSTTTSALPKTSTTATNSPASTASALSCPASNNQIYTYAGTGAQYVIECGIDHQAGDLSMVYVKNLEGCIASCATTSGCVDVSLSGTACYMKQTIGASSSSGSLLGARFIGYASLSSSTSTSSSTSSIISSTFVSSSILASTSSTTSTTSKASSTSSLSSSSSSSSSVISPSVGPDGYTTTSFPPTCTAINTNVYAVSDSDGTPYLYMCGGGSAGGTAATITNVANWSACFRACDSYSGCTGFSYNQGAAFGNGLGQCLIKTDRPQSFVSTAALLSTRMAAYIRPIATTSTTPNHSSVRSSSSLLSSSVIVTSTGAPPTASSFTTSTISSKSSISSSASSSTSPGVSPSSSPSASISVAKSVSCPSSNGTAYTDAKGLQYTILCTYDTSAHTITSASSVGSFGNCAELCDSTPGCTGLTFNGTVCSLKQSFGQYDLGAIKA